MDIYFYIEIIQFVAKITCIYLTVHFASLNLCKMVYGKGITFSNFAYMSAGITGFITLQWLI